MQYIYRCPMVLIDRNARLGQGFQVSITSREENGTIDTEPLSYVEAIEQGLLLLKRYNRQYNTNWHATDCLRVTEDGIAFNHDDDEACLELYSKVNSGMIKTERKPFLLRDSLIPPEDRIEQTDEHGNTRVAYSKRGWLQIIMFVHMDGGAPESTRKLMPLLFARAVQRRCRRITNIAETLYSIEHGTIADAMTFIRTLYDEGYILDKDFEQFIPGED